MKPCSLRPFYVWLVGFYSVWLAIVLGGNYLTEALEHWRIALAMLFGSYVAGSTPMGGGTVGFPILVLVMDLPASLGRNFGLAIQSIGMVSASIFVLCSRQPIAYSLLRPAMLASCVGTPLGAALVAPYISDLVIKLTFAVVWCSFGLMLIFNLNEVSRNTASVQQTKPGHRSLGVLVGFFGGIVASIIGVGIDMLIFAAMVLRYRADLKVAVPTSVILMAMTSVVGITSNLVLAALSPRFALSSELFYSWLAAAPVVAVGAPLGSFVVQRIPRAPTLAFVSLLCILQFIWTAYQERISAMALMLSLLAIALLNGIFMWLYRLGHRPGNRGKASQIVVTEPSLKNEEFTNSGPLR